jgi:hypothetical protein
MSKPKSPAPAPVASPTLASINPADLNQVTGGGSAASDTNALIGQVKDLLGSIKSINNVSSEAGFKPQEMMMFMMLLQQRNQAAQPTVTIAAPSTVWWGSGRR